MHCTFVCIFLSILIATCSRLYIIMHDVFSRICNLYRPLKMSVLYMGDEGKISIDLKEQNLLISILTENACPRCIVLGSCVPCQRTDCHTVDGRSVSQSTEKSWKMWRDPRTSFFHLWSQQYFTSQIMWVLDVMQVKVILWLNLCHWPCCVWGFQWSRLTIVNKFKTVQSKDQCWMKN